MYTIHYTFTVTHKMFEHYFTYFIFLWKNLFSSKNFDFNKINFLYM